MIGSQVLHYRIVEKLGEGGMGVVYRAEDTRLHRDVALKFLPDEALEREEDRARFIAEARAAAALDHPAICTVHDINEADGHYFIAMAYVEGRDLRDIIDSDGALPVLDAVRLGVQVAEGLSAAHEKGIVHRDIKSANVMVTPRGRAKIMDFGLAARAREDRSAAEDTTGGTVAYASPEQARGEAVDHRGDIWSFGVMLYEMVTGQLPFGGDYESAIVYSILNETPPPPSSVRDGVPAELDRIIARALAKSPEERYQTIDAMRDDLVQVRNSIDPTISRVASGTPAAAGASPWRRAAIAAAATAVMAWLAGQVASLVVARLQLSPHIVTMVTVGILALIPAAGIVAYSSARRGQRGWGRPQWIGVSANAVLAAALLYVMFAGKDLGAAMETVEVTNEEGQTIERAIPRGAFRKNFALYAFENRTGDESLDWLEYGVPTLLELDLYQDAFITARSPFDPSSWERLRQAGFQSWTDAPVALKRSIARELHEGQFVTGSVARDDDGSYMFRMQVNDSESGQPIEEKTYRGTDIFALADRMAVDVKHAVDVPAWHLDGARDVPVADMVTESEDALREYVGAMRAMTQEKDWTSAREHLDAAVAADSTMAFAHFHRFLAYRLTNDYQQAQKSLQDALRHAYKVPERFRFVIKGNYYFLRQEPEKAKALFEMMAELYPDDIESFQALAQIYSLRNEVDKSIAAYERVIELDPYQYDHLHTLASLCARKGDFEKALGYAQRYADLNPKDPRSFEEIAELNQRMGDFDRARENIDRALLLDPERVTLHIGAGNIDEAVGDFDAAEGHYREAMGFARSANDSMRVFNAMEDYHALRGEFALSIELMNRRLAMNRVPLNRYAERLEDVDRFVFAGRTDEALGILDETKRVFDGPPMSDAVSYGYLELYLALEQPDSIASAMTGFERYLQAFHLEALRPQVDHARARMLELRGDLDGAVSVYRGLVADNPGSSAAHRGLGRCLRKQGHFDEAEKELERALSLYPSYPQTHLELALLYHARGDDAKARAHLEKALEVWANADPPYHEAARARELAAEWAASASM